MIATKKAKLIRKHLGVNTPEWIVKNCIALLKEYEEIEWCNVPEEQANGDNKSDDKCTLPVVVPSTWIFFDEGHIDKPYFKITANTSSEAYDLAYSEYGPQVEDMMYTMM